jgi:D-beta-D-heptose 7-phosphate kinase/D-beta-D-heptose 1-phosphate adenosyltransferase
LTQLVDRFAALRVAVLGDLIVDRFVYGNAARLSPEAPVPVVQIHQRTMQPGGAANVGANVLSLGGRLALFGVLGDDDAGREMRELLDTRGANLSGVQSVTGRPSTVKTRLIAQSQQLVRFDEEETGFIDGQVSARLLKLLDDQLDTLDVVVLSDYAKGLVTRELAQGVIKRCRARGLAVVVDPKPANIDCFAEASVVKPNLAEALRLAGRERRPSDEEVGEVCHEVRQRVGCEAVVITAGARGMYVLENDEVVHLPGHPREVYDVAGAGDTTLAAIALALAAGTDLVTSARLGNLAGSIAVGKLGIAAVTQDELRREVKDAYGTAGS